MLKFADLINENVEELAALDTVDAGKLYDLGKIVDIPGAAETIHYYAGAADKIHGATLKMSRDLQAYTLHEPVGVVGHIIPWNFPSQMFVMKVGPALAAGCTMVVKPAEQTPLSALYYAHLAKLVGLQFFSVLWKEYQNVHNLTRIMPFGLRITIFRFLYAFLAPGWYPGWSA